MGMKPSIVIVSLSFCLLASCTPVTQTASSPEVVTVYGSLAAQPWMTELYTCANEHSILLNFTSQDPEIYLRLGEPEPLVSAAYRIGEEEILIVTNRESPVQNLSLEQAQALFAGQGDPSVQVWVYSADEDAQFAFDQLVMKGRGVTSFAKLATSPQQMSDILDAESNAVGILPRHWNPSTGSGQGMGSVREVYSAGTVPVLAITKAEPTGTTQGLIACIQK